MGATNIQPSRHFGWLDKGFAVPTTEQYGAIHFDFEANGIQLEADLQIKFDDEGIVINLMDANDEVVATTWATYGEIAIEDEEEDERSHVDCPRCGYEYYSEDGQGIDAELESIKSHGMCFDCHKKWQMGELE